MDENLCFQAREIETELKSDSGIKKPAINHIVLLAASALLFIASGLFSASIFNILLLVLVLLIHEAGHFLGMKIFGYANVHILFIPLMGAITSGKENIPSNTRRAVVLLLGPIPGIVIGIALWLAYFKTGNEGFILPARMFLFINVFNLLPLVPLDGGRFIETILFSCSPEIKLFFSFLAVAGLGFIAFKLKSPLLGVVVFIVLCTRQFSYKIGKIAMKVKEESPLQSEMYLLRIPPITYIEYMLEELQQTNFFEKWKLKAKTNYIQEIWNQIIYRPVSRAASLGFIALYCVVLFVSIVTFFVFDVGTNWKTHAYARIETVGPSGASQSKAVAVYMKGRLIDKIGLDEQGFAHGSFELYSAFGGVLKIRGQWFHGKWDGEWRHHDNHGNLKRITHFDKGRFISLIDISKKGWVKKTWNDLSESQKKKYRLHEEGSPKRVTINVPFRQENDKDQK